MNNFDINLPTIPSKCIRFKIQDIKASAFGSQKIRFPDRKSFLTKRFVQSFPNLYQSLPPKTQTTPTTPTKFSIEREEPFFQHYIPQHKKHLIPFFNEVRSTELNPDSSIQFQSHKGYSFGKEQRISQSLENKSDNFIENPEFMTENQYFLPKKSAVKNTPKKKAKISANFQSQSREKVFQRLASNSIVPGPGSYLKEEKEPAKPIKLRKPFKREKNKYSNPKRLADEINKIVDSPRQKIELPEEELKRPNDHMFINDDRDRFGNQMFSIAQKVNVPGPGAYQLHDNIEKRAKKIQILEEQRKVLKQWFNA